MSAAEQGFVSPKNLKTKAAHLVESARISVQNPFTPARNEICDQTGVVQETVPQLKLPISLNEDDFIVTESRHVSAEQVQFAVKAL